MLHTCSKKKIEKFTFVAPACDCQWPLFVQFNFSPQIAINIAAQVNRKKLWIQQLLPSILISLGVNLIWNRLAAAKSTFMLHLKYTIEFFRASGSTQIIKLGLHSHKFNADSVNYFHSTEYHSICCCHACCRCSTSILFLN